MRLSAHQTVAQCNTTVMFGCKLITGLTRRKTIDFVVSDSPFNRCMNVFDLTALGLSSLLDAGLYVVIGQIAHSVAGPSTIFSFLIAAISSLLAGLCYAEFSSRISRNGSGYIYTYVAMGEIFAFLAGWCMITEFILGSATLARACSEYIDFLFNGMVYTFFKQEIGAWNLPILGPFPDPLAFGLVIIASLIICSGVKQSKRVMDVTVLCNLLVITFIVFVGSYYADTRNWSSIEKFAPFGWTGILAATPSCFFCFIGLDVIPSASEEAINPSLSVPLSILLSLGVSLFAYIAVIVVLTMMVPYYRLTDLAPIAEAFSARAFGGSKYIVSVGAICSMLSSLLASSFASPRLLYSVAHDGLIFGCFARVDTERKIPLRAVAVSGSLGAILALLFNMQQLVEMVSMATITTYVMVSISVILSRYQPFKNTSTYEDHGAERKHSWLRFSFSRRKDRDQTNPRDHVTEACNASATELTSTIANVTVTIMILSMSALCVSLRIWIADLANNTEPITICFTTLYAFITVASLVVLGVQPQSTASVSFMIPAVPFLPALSIFINLMLLTMLHSFSYVRFASWMAVGKLQSYSKEHFPAKAS